MESIEDDLKKAWKAIEEKKRAPSLEERKKGEKAKEIEEKPLKFKEEGEKGGEKAESLEETVQEPQKTSQSWQESTPPENFFGNKPLGRKETEANAQRAMGGGTGANVERAGRIGGERAVPSYLNPRHDKVKYSPSKPDERMLKVENPFQERRDLGRNAIRPVTIKNQGFMENKGALKTHGSIIRDDKPYEPFEKSASPMGKKYKLLR